MSKDVEFQDVIYTVNVTTNPGELKAKFFLTFKYRNQI